MFIQRPNSDSARLYNYTKQIPFTFPQYDQLSFAMSLTFASAPPAPDPAHIIASAAAVITPPTSILTTRLATVLSSE
jgi:hypothetical protein